MTARRRAGHRPRLLLALTLPALLHGCTFERRAETEPSDPLPSALDTAGSSLDAPNEDSVLGVVEAFHRALRSGDAARVVQLVGPDALLVDQEEGVLWTARSAGPLPSSLHEGDPIPGGLAWERVGTRVDALGSARLVILRYRARVAGEGLAWWAVESLLLRAGPDGAWRIHFLHRSRGPGGPGVLK